MYRRPKFLEVLLDIRQEMAREADYDVDLYAEIIRHGSRVTQKKKYSLAEDSKNSDHQERGHSPSKVKQQNRA